MRQRYSLARFHLLLLQRFLECDQLNFRVFCHQVTQTKQEEPCFHQELQISKTKNRHDQIHRHDTMIHGYIFHSRRRT